jgi:DNA (cytosine-5)-methyltransferase 1
MMKYGSVCSGMEAATCAWHPLGWHPQFFSEFDATASRFLSAKYPDTPNLGDMTKFKEWPDATINVLVGGTPCQSFSVAGLRKGMADPRGNLALTYLAIADRYRPDWLVWENVPGVLSSNGGRDFGSILGGMAELGYGFAYRILDAQFVRVESHNRAVPQRRRRVFVVGHLGDWRCAAAVLFECESLSGNPAPRREAGKSSARGIEIGPSGGRFADVNPTLDARAKDGPVRNQIAGAVLCADVAPTLNAHFGEKQGLENQHINGGGIVRYLQRQCA